MILHIGALGLLTMAIQVYFAVHAYKNGHRFWIWIILIFSLIGCIAYFFAEYWSDIQGDQVAEKISSNIGKVIDPKREIKKLKEQVEFCDNVENRTALADAYIQVKEFLNAIPLLEKCLEGHYKDDIGILEKLAFSHFMTKSYDKAEGYLFKIESIDDKFESQEAHLLLAVCYELNEKEDQALKEYSRVVERYTGEEARCRYASLLKRTGKKAEAQEIFKKVVQHAKVSPKFYQREQAKWIEKAKRELK